MRKRNAITAAAATSLTFGGAATAVVNAHQNVAVASGAQAAGQAGGVAAPSRPKVVTVYVDDPTTTVAGAPTPITIKTRVIAHALPGSSQHDAPSSPPPAIPPRTARDPKPAPPAGTPSPKQPDEPPTTSQHHDTPTTEAPVVTTVPPVTTTTAASGQYHGDDD